MPQERVGVLFGGTSPAYPASLRSACAVLAQLDHAAYTAVPIGITHDGRFLRYTGRIRHIADDTWHTDTAHCRPVRQQAGRLIERDGTPLKLDRLFPVLPGTDGRLLMPLARASLPLAGCAPQAIAVCADKAKARRLAAPVGVRVPRSVVVRDSASLSALHKAAAGLTFPLFVKPVRAGLTFGVSCVRQPEELLPAVQRALAYDSRLLLEEVVPGRELGCGVLGGDDPLAGRVDEVERTPGFFDHTEPAPQSVKTYLPASMDANTEKRVQQTAVRLCRALGCTGLCRVELFLTPTGELVFNEINAAPELTPYSRAVRTLKAAGLPFSELLTRLLQQG